jgi:hypothetical protein
MVVISRSSRFPKSWLKCDARPGWQVGTGATPCRRSTAWRRVRYRQEHDLDEGGQASLPELGPQVLGGVDPAGAWRQVACQVAPKLGGGRGLPCRRERSRADCRRHRQQRTQQAALAAFIRGRPQVPRSLRRSGVPGRRGAQGSDKKGGHMVNDAVLKEDSLKDRLCDPRCLHQIQSLREGVPGCRGGR